MSSEQTTASRQPAFVNQSLQPQGSHHISDHAGVPFRCQFCIGQNFRRSRLRGTDVKSMFLMRYPVRCLRCRQRQFVSFTLAGISVPSHVRTSQRRRKQSPED